MNIRQIYSLDFGEANAILNQFSSIPSILLDWIAENQQEGFIIWDEDDRIHYTSNSINRFFSYSQDEIIGKLWKDIWDVQIINKINTDITEKRNKKNTFEINYRDKDNKENCIEFITEKLIDNDTGEVFHIGVIRDITEENEYKKMKLNTEKMSVLGQIAAGVAHEIRNPLTSIKGFLQLLQAGVNHKDEYYEIMADEIEKMEKITSELLFMSKPVTNDMKYESVDQMIREITVLLQTQAKLHGIVIKTDEKISQTKLFCDSSQIKQVLINLIKNAIEAMDNSGEIKVYSRESLQDIRICVEDEGTGLPTELMEQIVMPFFTTKKSGTGLGLSISKEIIEIHGGTLVYSKNKTKGSTFKIIFPKK